ncbi:MAG: hypothetical protein JW783_05310 [Bacteroidales bacterium]|nr:hypothetical protein [Bacteroidales bacterium]MBN2749394.1 hypothetical protein [Bacteroidales bacterium]
MKRILLLSLLLGAFIGKTKAQQTIDKPAVVEQSHKDMLIESITFYPDSTVFIVSIENKLAVGGWFCIDQNTYLEVPKKMARYKVRKQKGAPTCPTSHGFKKIGEVLRFSLVFNAVSPSTRTLNLVESCDKACFYFKGIILDTKLNADIKLYEEGVKLYADDRIDAAIDCFSRIVEVIPSNPIHVYGYSYYNLIHIYADKKDSQSAAFWFDQLKKSGLPDKQYFIDAVVRDRLLE